MRPRANQPSGIPAFLIVWLGQFLSVLATLMTQFALTIWIYAETERVTALALQHVSFLAPFLLVSPIAGAMVDRYNRKLMMMLSDLGAGLATTALLVLQANGRLEVWHLYAAAAVSGAFNCFQWPAYSATISLMMPKEYYGRASGLMSLLELGPGVLAPLLAGILLGMIGLVGIMLIDVATFLLAIGALLIIFVPQPPTTEAGRKGQGGLLMEAVYGFRYIFERPSLLSLQLVFFFANLFSGLGFTVLAPMILARTGNNVAIFGSVQSAGALGGIAGSLVMSAWGGFKPRVHGVLLGWMLRGVLGMVSLGIGRSSLAWMPAEFLGQFFSPLIDGSNQAIWQAKVAPDVQGRVFSARMLIAWFTYPVTPLIAGPLADFVLEPAMRSDSQLSHIFSWLVGTGPGSGMALLLTASGLLACLTGAVGYLVPAVRNAEERLPDHDIAPAALI